MKKFYKIMFTIIILLLFIQQCTSINLIPSLVNNKNDYKHLSANVSSDNYRVDIITDKIHAFVTYDTINNYFIVDDSYSITKINANGEVKIKIPHASGDLPYKTHFVFTDSTVCDLSKSELIFESYYKIIYAKEVELEQEWIALFGGYYHKASTVIYDYNDSDLVYMKLDEGWLLMYFPDGYYLQGDPISEWTFENYPAKYIPLIFLKEVEINIYSDWGSRIGSLDQRSYPENGLEYVNEQIKNVSFKKESISSRLAYIPVVSQFKGVGYYKLKKGDEWIRFKEDAYKYPFNLFNSESLLQHFLIPKKFQLKTEVSFLKYSFNPNRNESSSQGIYVIRRK